MKVGICGISGRMGKNILEIIFERGHSLGVAFEAENAPVIGQEVCSSKGKCNITINPINDKDISAVDGLIDFSAPPATLKLIAALKKVPKPLVIGTTGFTDSEKKIINDASRDIPLIFSPNMSVGVNLLFKLTEMAAKVLGDKFDIEIFEAHHRFKKDAPSGTANKLLEVVKASVPSLSDAPSFERTQKSEARSDKEIGMMVMRGGDIVGEHTVYFTGMGERIELTHRATSRETFARGSVLALEFLKDKKPGLYNMYDVLGI